MQPARTCTIDSVEPDRVPDSAHDCRDQDRAGYGTEQGQDELPGVHQVCGLNFVLAIGV
jgi:hypothetical protein